MKIQLDTTLKTIKLESDVKISDLIKILKKLLPDGEWKTFTLLLVSYCMSYLNTHTQRGI